ncbi:MAG: hypothetical protein ACK55Z_16115, partial [bacterium]
SSVTRTVGLLPTPRASVARTCKAVTPVSSATSEKLTEPSTRAVSVSDTDSLMSSSTSVPSDRSVCATTLINAVLNTAPSNGSEIVRRGRSTLTVNDTSSVPVLAKSSVAE